MNFVKRSMEDKSGVSFRICRKFELIQVFMHALVTCKKEDYSTKNKGTMKLLKGSYLRCPWSDLAEFRTHP